MDIAAITLTAVMWITALKQVWDQGGLPHPGLLNQTVVGQ